MQVRATNAVHHPLSRAANRSARYWGFALLFFLTACAGGLNFFDRKDEEFYRPPTSIPQTPMVMMQASPTPAATPTPAVLRPTATPVCANELRFLEDLTIPDGAQAAPGTNIDKRWKVENAGSCNWDNRYHLRLVEGPDLGAAPEQALYPARGGTQAVIRILFTAPAEPGAYRSAWQAYDPLGQAFGEIFFISFNVTTPW